MQYNPSPSLDPGTAYMSSRFDPMVVTPSFMAGYPARPTVAGAGINMLPGVAVILTPHYSSHCDSILSSSYTSISNING